MRRRCDTLVILDLTEFPGENIVQLLRATAADGIGGYFARRAACAWLADQIEAQTDPPLSRTTAPRDA